MPRRRTEPSIPESFLAIKADYDAAKSSRLRRRRKGLPSAGSSADYHYRSEVDYLRMMELSRDFCRNDVVIKKGVHRLVSNAIQDGFTLKPDTGDEEADAIILEEWTEWGKDPLRCHAAEKLTWNGIVKGVLNHVVVDGDILLRPLKDGSLETIEAHRVRSPRNSRKRKGLVHGVLLDRRRRVKEYWLTREDVDPNKAVVKIGEIERFPAKDGDGNSAFFHILNPERVSQTRGVTGVAPIVEYVGMHSDIQFAKLIQQQGASCWAVLKERDATYLGGEEGKTGTQTTETLADGSTRTLWGLQPGMMYEGAPGERLKGFSPSVPNPEWFDQAKMILTFISINFDIPLPVLLLDPTQTNFSGWRGAMNQAIIGFRVVQQWIEEQLHRRVYQWKVRNFIEENAKLKRLSKKRGVRISRHFWNPPAWRYIEPMKDVGADLMEVRNGLNSLRRVHARRGRDWPTISKEIVGDIGLHIVNAKKRAAEINTMFPQDDPVHWRELLSLATADGVSLTIDTENEEKQDDNSNAPGKGDDKGNTEDGSRRRKRAAGSSSSRSVLRPVGCGG
ncbi:MAG: phage portal protein [Planctomycetota bacterium]